MKIFHVGSHQFRESLRELLREFWFSYCSSRGMPFREWNFEFREPLREYPGTFPALREWPVCSECIFPEIRVVPRLLMKFCVFCRSRCLSQQLRTPSPEPQKAARASNFDQAVQGAFAHQKPRNSIIRIRCQVSHQKFWKCLRVDRVCHKQP